MFGVAVRVISVPAVAEVELAEAVPPPAVVTVMVCSAAGALVIVIDSSFLSLPTLLRARTVNWAVCSAVGVPLITPVIFYNLVTQLCQAFQEFNGPFIITQGGPRNATMLISMLIYNNAFKSYEMGLASAQAWLLFLIVMTFTAIAFFSQKHWVYYSDEDGR